MDYIERVHARILIAKGAHVEVPDNVRQLFASSYRPNRMEAQPPVVAPPQLLLWGVFDAERNPVCVLTLHTEDIIGVTGLRESGEGIYQVVDDDSWRGIFKSSELKRRLIKLTAELKMSDSTPPQSTNEMKR